MIRVRCERRPTMHAGGKAQDGLEQMSEAHELSERSEGVWMKLKWMKRSGWREKLKWSKSRGDRGPKDAFKWMKQRGCSQVDEVKWTKSSGWSQEGGWSQVHDKVKWMTSSELRSECCEQNTFKWTQWKWSQVNEAMWMKLPEWSEVSETKSMNCGEWSESREKHLER